MASSNKPSGRPSIYNAEALHDKLEDISWPEGLEWPEAQALTLDAPPINDIEDDLARELSFYTQV
jgi:Eukaryotic rRNA processing protein EBP2